MENLNCCQLCSKKVCDSFCVELNESEYNILSGLGDGFGVGGLCGALIGAIAGAGIVLDGKNIQEARVYIILKFMKKFSTINCSGLENYYDDCCKEVIDFAVNAANDFINKNK